MLVDLEKLKSLGYEKINGETYGKKENDFYTKIVQVKLNSNVIVSRYLKTSKLSIVNSEQIKEIIQYYKELSADYKNCLIEEKVEGKLLTNEEKNYLNVMLAQCKDNVVYITIVKKLDKKMLRVRYNIGSYYSYIPLEKGFEKLKQNQNYTLEELGI